MRICTVSPINPYEPCGATYNTTGLVDGFKSLGHETRLVCFKKLIGDIPVRENPDYDIVRYYNIVPRRWYSLRDVFDRQWQKAATKRVLKYCSEKKTDIMFIRATYYPYITIRELKKKYDVKTAVLSYPLKVGQSQIGRIPKRLMEKMMEYEKKSLEACDRILAYSPPVAEIIMNDYGIPKDKISLTRPGVDIKRFSLGADIREKLGWNGKTIIGFIGSVVKWQGIEHLVAAAPRIISEYPEVRFAILGSTPDKNYQSLLKRSIFENGLQDKFMFYPPVPHEEVPSYMKSVDVFVAPYVRTNPPMSIVFPIKLAEAAAAGCRIVTTDQPGLAWFLKDGINAMLAIPNDHESLADKILELLGDKDLGERIRQNVLRIAGQFDWKAVAGDAVEAVVGRESV